MTSAARSSGESAIADISSSGTMRHTPGHRRGERGTVLEGSSAQRPTLRGSRPALVDVRRVHARPE